MVLVLKSVRNLRSSLCKVGAPAGNKSTQLAPHTDTAGGVGCGGMQLGLLL